MKEYRYNLDDAEFLNPDGEKIPRCVPELCYQEHAVWRIFLRDRSDRPRDFTGIVAWSAAVDCDFKADSAPMCRALPEDISADAAAGSVTVRLNAATAEFLAAVGGSSGKSACFELYGLNSAGERVIYLCFRINARMTLDPDPAASPEVPETLATKTYTRLAISGALVSGGYITSSGAAAVASGAARSAASGAIFSGSAFDTVIGSARITATSGGVLVSAGGAVVNIASGAIVGSGASGESMVLSGGIVPLHVEDGDGEHQDVTLDTGGVHITAAGPCREVLITQGNDQIEIGDSGVLVNSRPVLTDLVTSTDSETTSASFAVLEGGTSYKFTQPLTSLSVASVASSMRESWIEFTVASGGSVSINDSGLRWFGRRRSAYEGGSSYALGVWNGLIVCNELEE